MIRLDHLTKRFGRFTAVDDLSLTIGQGEAVALWGPNGAGKTTIIRCVLGLIRFNGSISVAGFDVRRRGKAARRMIGYVPQELAFHDDLRAADALGFLASLKRTPRERIGVVLREVGLEGHARKRVRELSGGMKQRLALAAALLADPPVLILDELTSNLDAEAQSGFMSLLKSLKDRGKTILFTSHHYAEVRALADRVLMLERGRVVRQGQPDAAAGIAENLLMKVFVADGQIEQAAATLTRCGFEASRNGCGVHVVVNPRAKAGPIHALAETRIRVEDFELLGNGHLPSAASTPAPETHHAQGDRHV